MFACHSDRRGSGLIVALSVLAMLAIMATSFVTLTRLEVRITTNYVDDLKCELLAKGALNYFKALLRDDLDGWSRRGGGCPVADTERSRSHAGGSSVGRTAGVF